MEKSTSPYVLVRVDQDGTEEQVSEHPDFEQGWAEGQHRTHVEPQAAFALYHRGRRVARFCHHRIAVRAQSFDWSVLS